MTNLKKQSGTARICESMISQALLNCKVTNVHSLVDKMNEITSYKFDVSVYDCPDNLEGNGPWKIQLLIGDTKVLVIFSLSENQFITKIEVKE